MSPAEEEEGPPSWLGMHARWKGDLSVGPLSRLACTRRAHRCMGFVLGPPVGNFSPGMWRGLKEVDLISVVTQFSQTYARQDPSIFKLHHIITPHIEDATRDCAGGVVTGLVYGLADISQTLSDGFALQAFKLASLVYWSLRACGGSDWELTVPGSSGTRFAPNFQALPLLFGLERRSCGEGAPRIFVRDVGRAGHVVRCSSGLRSTETWFHRQVLFSDCATNDPSAADQIFVPLYSLCNHYRKQRWSELIDYAHRFPFVRPYFELAEEHSKILEKLKKETDTLERHFLFFPEEKWPMFGMGHDALRQQRPRLLVVEARPVHCTHYDRVRSNELVISWRGPHPMRWRCFHCHSCFRHGYDLVVPSFIDYYSRSLLRGEQRSYEDRAWLLAWFGNGGPDSQDGSYCEVVNWRWRLAALQGFEGALIGGHHERYEYILGASRFCLVPKGLGYWTHRLYEVIQAGCVPVILSDHIVLPFEGVKGIHWPSFSVKWPEENIGLDLYHWLLFIDVDRGPLLRAALDRVACWFDYHGEGDCNAVNAALHAMASPVPEPLPPFWNAPPFELQTPEELLQRWIRERAQATNTSETPRMEVFHERMRASQYYGGALA